MEKVFHGNYTNCHKSRNKDGNGDTARLSPAEREKLKQQAVAKSKPLAPKSFEFGIEGSE